MIVIIQTSLPRARLLGTYMKTCGDIQTLYYRAIKFIVVQNWFNSEYIFYKIHLVGPYVYNLNYLIH